MSSPQPDEVEPDGPVDLDGRRLRRERNRLAVVDAMLSLVSEGNLTPSTTEIAERAGSSARSLFRYFDDVDDLTRQAVERHVERVGHLLVIDSAPDRPLPSRIEALVEARLAFFDAAGDVAVVARMRAPVVPLIKSVLVTMRQRLRAQVLHLFGPELDAMPEADAAEVVSALEVLIAYESIAQLRDVHGMSRDDSRRVLTFAVGRLLAPAGG